MPTSKETQMDQLDKHEGQPIWLLLFLTFLAVLFSPALKLKDWLKGLIGRD